MTTVLLKRKALDMSFLPPGLPAGFEQQEQGWGGEGHYKIYVKLFLHMFSEENGVQT